MSNQIGMVTLALYGEDDEIVRELSRPFIPWGIQKKAVKLGKLLKSQMKDGDDLDDDDVEVFDHIGRLICTFFQDKITLEELDEYADKNDVMNVFRLIAGYSGNSNAAAKPRER